MNDHQMMILADDHRRDLLAEADRERLARRSALGVTGHRTEKPEPPRRLGLALLRGRVSFS